MNTNQIGHHRKVERVRIPTERRAGTAGQLGRARREGLTARYCFTRDGSRHDGSQYRQQGCAQTQC